MKKLCLAAATVLLLAACAHHQTAMSANQGTAASPAAITNAPIAMPVEYPAPVVTIVSTNSAPVDPVATTDTNASPLAKTDTTSPDAPGMGTLAVPDVHTTATTVDAAGGIPVPGESPLAGPGDMSTNNIPPAPPAPPQPVVVLTTSLGPIVIQLDDAAAPHTCENFRKLVAEGFYNKTIFHRVIPHFMIQGGDPNSKSTDRDTYGLGGPGYALPAEIKLRHDRGSVAMARLPDSLNPHRASNGSQFYICLVPCPSLDDQYTVFGHVVRGMEVADQIAALPRDTRDDPVDRVEMTATLEPLDQALTETPAGH
jgi:cyclophilin family peptidyl-prolyl cis-trans isomerase